MFFSTLVFNYEMFLKCLCAVEHIGVPLEARGAIHGITLTPFTALDELVGTFCWEIELAELGIFFGARVVISAVVTWA